MEGAGAARRAGLGATLGAAPTKRRRATTTTTTATATATATTSAVLSTSPRSSRPGGGPSHPRQPVGSCQRPLQQDAQLQGTVPGLALRSHASRLAALARRTLLRPTWTAAAHARVAAASGAAGCGHAGHAAPAGSAAAPQSRAPGSHLPSPPPAPQQQAGGRSRGQAAQATERCWPSAPTHPPTHPPHTHHTHTYTHATGAPAPPPPQCARLQVCRQLSLLLAQRLVLSLQVILLNPCRLPSTPIAAAAATAIVI